MSTIAKRSKFVRLGRWLRLHGLRSLREDSTPLRTSLGAGLGAFLGIFPTFGFGGPLAFLLARRLGWNRAAAVGGAVLSMNPVTAPIFIPLSAWLGVYLLQTDPQASGPLTSVLGYGGAFLLGNILLATGVAGLFGVTGYFLVRRNGRRRRLAPRQHSHANSIA